MNTETTGSVPSLLAQGEQMVARAWKLIALRGAVLIAFAIVLLVWPDIGLATMVTVVGIFAIVTGIVTWAAAWAMPGSDSTPYRIWMGVNGLLGVGIGVAMLVWPDLSATGLLYAIAIWAIAVGIIELVSGLVLPLSPLQTFLVVLSGFVMAGFGVVMFVEPGDGAIALLALVAAFAMVRGIFDIGLAVELRHVAGELKERVRPPISAKPVTHG
jgi:uncharacterized membrane protein HdeD (DUF308 family)